MPQEVVAPSAIETKPSGQRLEPSASTYESHVYSVAEAFVPEESGFGRRGACIRGAGEERYISDLADSQGDIPDGATHKQLLLGPPPLQLHRRRRLVVPTMGYDANYHDHLTANVLHMFYA